MFLRDLATRQTNTCSKSRKETLEKKCEICSKLTIKIPERRQWSRFGIFVVNFKHIFHTFLPGMLPKRLFKVF